MSLHKPIKFIRFWRRYGEDYLFLLPYTLIFLIFTVLPVVLSIGLSFTYFNVFETPHFTGIDNYIKLFFNDSTFTLALKNTLLISLITGPVGYMLCLMLAWLVNEFPPRLRAFITLLFYAPSISGGVFMIWQLILSNDAYGLLNGFLLNSNLIYEPIQWTSDERYMFGACVVLILWMSIGTSFLSFIAGFQNVNRTLYEAGAVDGVRTRWQEAWYITLPSIRPQLLFGAVMSITASFGVGDTISGIFGLPSTNNALHTLVHHLQDYGNIRFEMGYASAIATVLFAIMIGANKLVQHVLKKVGV